MFWSNFFFSWLFPSALEFYSILFPGAVDFHLNPEGMHFATLPNSLIFLSLGEMRRTQMMYSDFPVLAITLYLHACINRSHLLFWVPFEVYRKCKQAFFNSSCVYYSQWFYTLMTGHIKHSDRSLKVSFCWLFWIFFYLWWWSDSLSSYILNFNEKSNLREKIIMSCWCLTIYQNTHSS